jgi:hypothetical protein
MPKKQKDPHAVYLGQLGGKGTQAKAEAESSVLGFTRGFDDLVDLLGTQSIRPLLLGFLPDNSKDFGLRDREAHIILDAE